MKRFTRVTKERRRTYVIAEIGVNHDGSVERAIQMIDVAKELGADCAKFQTFSADRIIVPNAPKAKYQIANTGEAESQYEMLKKLELDREQTLRLKEHCQKVGIDFLSTPYNIADIDMLCDLGCDTLKIASGQCVETPFVRHVASKGVSIILSTGMCTLADVVEAVRAIEAENPDPSLVLLQCTTNYPAAPHELNLTAMCTLAALGYPVGFSDHCETNYAAFAAVALGATVIEKHFTLDRTLPGPDHRASLDPAGFRDLITGIRAVEDALGSGVKAPMPSEVDNAPRMRRSIVANRDLPKGHVLEACDVEFKRPEGGLRPKDLALVLGRPLRRDVAQNKAFELGDFEW